MCIGIGIGVRLLCLSEPFFFAVCFFLLDDVDDAVFWWVCTWRVKLRVVACHIYRCLPRKFSDWYIVHSASAARSMACYINII